ncbi:MAG: hypothetical protein ACT6UH_06305 [Hydrogenophaga sp.]|uniref:hypothetical protein n=1 Tax=Hydrogenophaga sp. TaxID=1904254 RepID=UPI00403680F5
MDGSDVKFLAPSTPQESKFEIAQGIVSIEGRSLGFRGFGGVRHLSLSSGWSFDLTSGVGGAEQLRLCGVSEDYCASMKGNVLTLSHLAQGTIVKLQAGRGPCRIVFDDGFVGVGDLWRNMTQAAALSRLTGESGLTDSAMVASHVHPSRDAAFLVGAHVLPEGALLRAAGLDRVETVYEPDAGLPICLEGAFADYGVTAQGMVIALDRQRHGCFEGVYLVGASQLNFADGQVEMGALRDALQSLCLGPMSEDLFSPQMDEPVATSVALSIEPTASCSESWFGGLFHGGLLSGLCVGQVFEVAVSFNEAMCVWGAPQVELRLGRLNRVAQYRGRSGGETLRFTYVVTEDDVLETSLNAAEVSVARAERLRLDIEVGNLLLNGAEIHPFSDLRYRHAGVAREEGMHTVTPDYHRMLQERAGFRMKVDVNLDELERVDDLLCH